MLLYELIRTIEERRDDRKSIDDLAEEIVSHLRVAQQQTTPRTTIASFIDAYGGNVQLAKSALKNVKLPPATLKNFAQAAHELWG